LREITFSFPAASVNAIAATQSITASAGGGVILNGSLAPIGNLTPSATTATSGSYLTNKPFTLSGIARPVTISATSSATGVVFTVVGFDARGIAQTASFLGASGGSSTASDFTATGSGTDFTIITAVQTSASMGNFTVGIGATGSSRWIETQIFSNPFNIAISVNPATSGPITIQDTPDDANAAAPVNIFNHATLVAVVAAQQSNYAMPVRFTRAICVPTQIAGATAVSTVNYIQTGV
jgi:hypothetical protein